MVAFTFTSVKIPGTATNTRVGFVRRALGLLFEKVNMVGTTTRFVTTVTVALKTLMPLADRLTDMPPPTQELKAIRTFTVTEREQNTRFTVEIIATYEKPVGPGIRKHPMFVSVLGWAIEQMVTIIESIISIGTTIPEMCLMLPCMFVKTTFSATKVNSRNETLVSRLPETKLEKHLLDVSVSLRLARHRVRQRTI